jgi:hypothetical protein
MFHDSAAFDVRHSNTTKREILCIGHAVDKKLLIGPLVATVYVAAGMAVGAGYLTSSVACGAEVGSFVGTLLALIWAYILWTLE